jgi:hypothetical protein
MLGVVVPFCVMEITFCEPIMVLVILWPATNDVPFAPDCVVVYVFESPVIVMLFSTYLLLIVLVIALLLPTASKLYW